jgi:PEGA domain
MKRVKQFFLVCLKSALGVSLALCLAYPRIAMPQARGLSLRQIEELVRIHTPDSVVAQEIRSRGLDFTPTPEVLEGLQRRGAGETTIAAVRARMPVGTLEINAAPGSQVTLDGEDRGTTDVQGRLVLPDLPAGSHQLTVSRPNYKRGEFTVTLAAREYKRFPVQLEWAGGYITVQINRAGSTIQIRGLGQYSGAVSSLQVPVGTYSITVTHLGMKSNTQSVDVTSGQHAVVEIHLVPDAQWVAARLKDAEGRRDAGDIAGAVRAATEVLAADPTNDSARASVYQSYLSGGTAALNGDNWNGALTYFQDATNFDPSKPDAWAGLGSANLALGRTAELGPAWDRALALGGTLSIEFWHERGLHFEEGTLHLSTEEISFVTLTKETVFSSAFKDVSFHKTGSGSVFSPSSLLGLKISRKTYRMFPVPLGFTCDSPIRGNCQPGSAASRQMTVIARYVDQAIGKAASGSFSLPPLPPASAGSGSAIPPPSPGGAAAQPGTFSEGTLLSHGFVFGDQPRPMCTIKGPDGPCQVEAFIGGESRDDRTGWTCAKLDRATYVGHCVGGALEGVCLLNADGSSKSTREAFLSYFSKGRIAYPALTSYLDANQPAFFGAREKTVSYGCVVFGRWDNSQTRGSCPKFIDIYGPDIFTEGNVQALRNGTFDLGHYAAKFTDYIQQGRHSQSPGELTSAPSAGLAQSSPTSAPGTITKSFALSDAFGSREIVQFQVAQPGRIVLEAHWAGNTPLALILNGPGRGGAYARKDGVSPLTVEYFVTSQDISSGNGWRASIVNFSRQGPVTGTLSVTTTGSSGVGESTTEVIREFPGYCPGEGGCIYRKWTAKGDISIYQNRSTSSPIIFSLRKGEQVDGLTAILDINRMGEAAVTKDTLKPQTGVALKAGEVVKVYFYEGEGCAMIEVAGVPSDFCDVESLRQVTAPRITLWLQVRSLAGVTGWSNQRELFYGTSQYDQ